MVYDLTKEEFTAVSGLPAPKRYLHSLKRMADCEIVWSLWAHDGWVMAGDDLRLLVIPIWPHSEYAKVCATNRWKGAKRRSIPLDVWLDRWVPGIERDKRLIVVFPTPSAKGIVVTPIQLRDDLSLIRKIWRIGESRYCRIAI